jgi:four helix bundle protein
LKKKNNITMTKSYDLAVRMIKLYQHLTGKKKEFILSKQLIRSGTSIAANIREAYDAESDKDFVHKLAISQKECSEAGLWLELLKDTDYLSEKEFESIYADTEEVYKIITSIILTKKQNMKKKKIDV